MGASLWDQVWGPLLIGVAIDIVVAALCFLSVRLWNCLMKLIQTQTQTVGESADDQPLPNSDPAANANGVRDLEMGNGTGPAQAPKAQITRDAARGASVPVEMDVPHSQKEEAAAAE